MSEKSEAAKLLRESVEDWKEIQSLWDSALMGAAENTRSAGALHQSDIASIKEEIAQKRQKEAEEKAKAEAEAKKKAEEEAKKKAEAEAKKKAKAEEEAKRKAEAEAKKKAEAEAKKKAEEEAKKKAEEEAKRKAEAEAKKKAEAEAKKKAEEEAVAETTKRTTKSGESVKGNEEKNFQGEVQEERKYPVIDEDMARRAKQMNSFDDYKEGSATAEYMRQVKYAEELAKEQKKKVDPMYHQEIDKTLQKYINQLAKNTNDFNRNRASVPSAMISGAGHYPVSRLNKANEREGKLWKELEEIEKLLTKIKSIGTGGIRSDDDNAIAKLEQKLMQLVKAQNDIKEANAYYRKNKTLEGVKLSDDNAEKEAKESWEFHVKEYGADRAVPYMPFTLSNLSSQIRNTRGRIEELKKAEGVVWPEWDFEGGHAVANKEENRLQLMFDEKPDKDTIAELKHNGFIWSNKFKAWQRQLNENAYIGASKVKAVEAVGDKSIQDMWAELRNARINDVQYELYDEEGELYDLIDPEELSDEELLEKGIEEKYGEGTEEGILESDEFTKETEEELKGQYNQLKKGKAILDEEKLEDFVRKYIKEIENGIAYYNRYADGGVLEAGRKARAHAVASFESVIKSLARSVAENKTLSYEKIRKKAEKIIKEMYGYLYIA